MKNWQIFIVTHKKFFDWMYQNDPLFSPKHFQFISELKIEESDPKYPLIYTSEMPVFTAFGTEYQESRVFFNLFQNPGFYEHLDFIGFIHYDFELNIGLGKSVTEVIESYIQNKDKAHISFATYDFESIYHQQYLADETQPEKMQGDGLNCFDYILNDYNQYFDTTFTVDNLFQKKSINLNCAFLIDCQTFKKMMGFCTHIMRSGKLNIFGKEHRRLGGLMERYIAVFLTLEYPTSLQIDLPHHYLLKEKM